MNPTDPAAYDWPAETEPVSETPACADCDLPASHERENGRVKVCRAHAIEYDAEKKWSQDDGW